MPPEKESSDADATRDGAERPRLAAESAVDSSIATSALVDGLGCGAPTAVGEPFSTVEPERSTTLGACRTADGSELAASSVSVPKTSHRGVGPTKLVLRSGTLLPFRLTDSSCTEAVCVSLRSEPIRPESRMLGSRREGAKPAEKAAPTAL
jgi:hypothetical protein